LQKKPDLKTKLPTQKTNCDYFSSVASQSIRSEDLLGMEGVKHREWAGALGQADPAKLQKTRGAAALA